MALPPGRSTLSTRSAMTLTDSSQKARVRMSMPNPRARSAARFSPVDARSFS